MTDSIPATAARTRTYYEVHESAWGCIGTYDTKEDADVAARKADRTMHGRISIWRVHAEQVPVPWGTTDGY